MYPTQLEPLAGPDGNAPSPLIQSPNGMSRHVTVWPEDITLQTQVQSSPLTQEKSCVYKALRYLQ